MLPERTLQEAPEGTKNDFHKKLVNYLSEIYGNKLTTEKMEHGWMIRVMHGKLEINIIYKSNKNYIDVIHRFSLHFEAEKILNENLDEASAVEFDHGLRFALTFPNTFYFIRTSETDKKIGIPTGFDVGATLFPLEKDFSLNILQNAIQNVVNASALGISFFSLKLKSDKEFMEFLKELNSSPEGMYA